MLVRRSKTNEATTKRYNRWLQGQAFSNIYILVQINLEASTDKLTAGNSH